MKKIVFPVLAVITLVIFIPLSYKRDNLRISPSYKSSSMHGFRLIHKVGNRVKWELVAQDAFFPDGSAEINIRSLELNIYGEYRVNLTAGSGTYSIDRKVLTISRPVHINVRDVTIMTETLIWDGERGLIKSDKEVIFRGKNFHIQGKGLEAEVKHERIRVLNDVKATFYL